MKFLKITRAFRPRL